MEPRDEGRPFATLIRTIDAVNSRDHRYAWTRDVMANMIRVNNQISWRVAIEGLFQDAADFDV